LDPRPMTRVPRLTTIMLLLAATACTQPRGRQFPGPMLPIGGVAVRADSVPSIPGFSSAVKRGLVMYLSGQVPLDSAARLVGAGDLQAQTVQSVQNLLRVVRAGRGLPGDVAKLTFYVVDLDSAAAETVRSAAAGLFTELPPPAMTIVGVASLPGSGMRVAVDGVAVLRGEYPDRERTEGPMRQPE
ncbi:MAG TPA: RidA family protein, partial [Gemmatimonadales bacterium]|nr:RidA family protein [Gemmatimonadales bacterium]